MAWTSMDGESLRSGSNQGSVAHLSEVNQESITSQGTGQQWMIIMQKKNNSTAELPNEIQVKPIIEIEQQPKLLA